MMFDTRLWVLAVCLGAGLLAACDGGATDDPITDAGDTAPDPEPDTTPEPEPDAAPEPEPDAAPEPEPDATPEPEPDAAPDPEPDAAPDPEPDMAPDPEPDGGPGCGDGETRPCDVIDGCRGQQTCAEGAFGPCRAPVEVCDGADTDCNGVVDDVEGAGAPCAVGVGACATDGAMTCGPEGELACDATPGAPADEICANHIDDDCDGAVDCDDGACDDDPICAPPVEICDNGVDDDLDRRIDCEDPSCFDAEICAPQGCGDGVRDPGEACDDGNPDNGDGCDARCTPEVFDALRGIERFEHSFTAGESDVVRFTVDHDPSRLIARTSDGFDGCPGEVALEVSPVDAAGVRGAIVGGAVDGGISGCALLDIALAPGDYALVVRGVDGVGLAGVVLDYRLEVNIGAGGAYDGAADAAGDDLYGFTLAGPATVTLDAGDGDGGCPGAITLTVFGFDPDGARVQVGFDEGGPDACPSTELALEAGAYEVEISGSAGAGLPAYVLIASIQPEPNPAVEVAIVDFAMAPDPVVIQVGQTVRWTNLDPSTHTVTSGEPGTALAGAIFDSGNLGQGDTFEFTFLSAGEFLYFCRPHAGFMRDYRVVVEGPPDPDQGACEESCADLQGCFGIPPDPECVDGCLSSPGNRATGRCIAERLDPGAGQCDFAVIQACNTP